MLALANSWGKSSARTLPRPPSGATGPYYTFPPDLARSFVGQEAQQAASVAETPGNTVESRITRVMQEQSQTTVELLVVGVVDIANAVYSFQRMTAAPPQSWMRMKLREPTRTVMTVVQVLNLMQFVWRKKELPKCCLSPKEVPMEVDDDGTDEEQRGTLLDDARWPPRDLEHYTFWTFGQGHSRAGAFAAGVAWRDLPCDAYQRVADFLSVLTADV